jgi:hypothetical protein
METLVKGIGALVVALLLIGFAALVLGYPTMLLWNNCLVPAVNGVHEIGFLQTIGLLFLFAILFKPTTTSKKD